MAGVRASERGRKVLLLERNASAGTKLLISGNGRCNLTNTAELAEFLDKFSSSRFFLRNAFAQFFNSDLMTFFEEEGVKLKTEDSGKVFPKSDKAKDVLNVLLSKLKNSGVNIAFGERVSKINIKDCAVEGVFTYSGGAYSTSHAVIATGGCSYPQTGSSGDGFTLAEKLGHNVIQPRPAGVPIMIKEEIIRQWQGLSFDDAEITVFSEGKRLCRVRGQMIFTHFGVSGPAILDIGGFVSEEKDNRRNVAISINLMPGFDKQKMDELLLRKFKANPSVSVKNMIKNFMPNRMVDGFLVCCRTNGDKSVSQLKADERVRVVEGLTDFRLTAEGTPSVDEAIVTRGGVDTKEINPKTMESKIVKGLFFAGEVIDIDAATGGYNMQAAFSTGWVCGDNI